jgi:hypothetical protein
MRPTEVVVVAFLCPIILSGCGDDKPTTPQTQQLVPVAFYPFDGNVNDSTANGHDGTLHGAVAFVADRFNDPEAAIQLDGSGQYVSLPHDISITRDLSISFWIETSSSDANNWPWGTFIIDRDVNSAVRDWSVTMGMGGKLLFNSGTGTSDYVLTSNADINTNAWNHIVVIRDGSTGEKRIYVNAVEDVSSNFDSQPFGNNDRPIYIGASVPDTPTHTYFEGKLDDVRFYNRVLPDSVISELYHERGWPPADR